MISTAWSIASLVIEPGGLAGCRLGIQRDGRPTLQVKSELRSVHALPEHPATSGERDDQKDQQGASRTPSTGSCHVCCPPYPGRCPVRESDLPSAAPHTSRLGRPSRPDASPESIPDWSVRARATGVASAWLRVTAPVPTRGQSSAVPDPRSSRVIVADASHCAPVEAQLDTWSDQQRHRRLVERRDRSVQAARRDDVLTDPKPAASSPPLGCGAADLGPPARCATRGIASSTTRTTSPIGILHLGRTRARSGRRPSRCSPVALGRVEERRRAPRRRSDVLAPRCSHAAGVAIRPRGVRASNPARTRYGSATSSTVSRSSPTATARVPSPTGPPPNLCTSASSTERSRRSSPRASTS